MLCKALRGTLAAIVFCLAIVSVPSESHAIFHWFRRCCQGGWFGSSAYAPAYDSYAGNGCNACAPQVANYVPQTCYRTQWVAVPTTTMRPVTSYDPCTGCPVTCLRPMVSYVQRPRLIPYNSYRIVYSNPAGSGCCGQSTASYYAPGGYQAAGGCSNCAASGAIPTYGSAGYAPTRLSSPNTYDAMPRYESAAPSNAVRSSDRSTFEPGTGSADGTTSEPETRLKPIPDSSLNDDRGAGASGKSSTGETGTQDASDAAGPRLDASDSRTTARPRRVAWAYHRIHWAVRGPRAGDREAVADAEMSTVVRPVSRRASVQANRETPPRHVAVDENGWRPSSR